MIDSIKFLSGFPIDLPLVGEKTFHFKPGINILFGANGTGKSVILNTIKAYCGIEKGGWTKVNDPSVIGTSFIGKMHEAEDFPHAYKQFSPAKSKAIVSWDGVPSFFNDGDIKVNDIFFYHSVGNSEDGITSEEEQFDMILNKPSSGQYRTHKINKILDIISKGVPYSEIDAIPSKIHNRAMAQREIDYWRYLRRKAQGQVPTILLDEPERALSLPKQRKFFTEVIPNHLKNCQVIMATHSPFSLLIPDANVIEMQSGYKEECIDCFKLFSKLCT